MSNILKQRLEASQSAQADHPSTDTLSAFIEHGLKGRAHQQVISHLAVCRVCRHAVALATPEVIGDNAEAAAPSKLTLRFPAAIRWASLAAALAVAVGVGVISYEHEASKQSRNVGGHEITGTPASTAGNVPPSTSIAEAPNPQLAQTRPALGYADTRGQKAGKKRLLSSRDRAEVASVGDAELKNGNLTPENSPTSSNSLGARLGKEENGARAVEERTTQANSFAVGQVSKYDKSSGSREQNPALTATTAVAPISQPQAPAPVPKQSEQGLDTYGELGQANGRSSSAQAGSVKGGLVGGTAGAMLQAQAVSPAKAVRSAAIGGPVTAKTLALEDAGLVGWTISASGRLQRSSTNGVVTTVEPAPGVSIRAVAAEGIEVWAAGAEPNLTSQQWQQRPVLFHSSDAGETWTQVSGPWQSPITSLRLASKNNLSVVAQDGTWITADAGKNWSRR